MVVFLNFGILSIKVPHEALCASLRTAVIRRKSSLKTFYSLIWYLFGVHSLVCVVKLQRNLMGNQLPNYITHAKLCMLITVTEISISIENK